ncbi:OmpW/AlkL family protein [Marinicella rhabdoformis]|uniref:OmpW/AlkL family protein n=1 Tax=Marinicella rhabdoformis TaxID=2580566 RepID=UPI0015CFDFCD|nr:OmpW family outer membrane protein [Marinicella rhabdoformis]
MKKTLTLSLALLCGSSIAVDKGDWIFHARAINISPNDDSSLIRVDGAGVPGTGVNVDDNFSLDLSLAYMFSDHWAVELLADLSSKHNVSAYGLSDLGVPNGTDVVETNVLPPTVFLQYQFRPSEKVRPYMGVGVNHTLFFSDKLTPAAKDVLGASGLSLESSFGLGAQFGIDFEMKNDWFLNIDLKYIQIDTEAKFDTAIGRASVDVDINPTVFGIGFGRTF